MKTKLLLLAPFVSIFLFSCHKEDVNPDQTVNTQTVVVTSDPSTQKDYSNILLGAQYNANPSYFSPTKGMAFGSKDSSSFVVNKVDFSLYQTQQYGGLTFVSMAKRREAGLTKILNVSRNTFFKLSNFSAAQFDTISNPKTINSLVASSIQNTSVYEGSVYEFVNEEGNKGLIKIISAQSGSNFNGSVTMEVKFVN